MQLCGYGNVYSGVYAVFSIHISSRRPLSDSECESREGAFVSAGSAVDPVGQRTVWRCLTCLTAHRSPSGFSIQASRALMSQTL